MNMEKLFLVIVALNVIGSIFVKLKKKNTGDTTGKTPLPSNGTLPDLAEMLFKKASASLQKKQQENSSKKSLQKQDTSKGPMFQQMRGELDTAAKKALHKKESTAKEFPKGTPITQRNSTRNNEAAWKLDGPNREFPTQNVDEANRSPLDLFPNLRELLGEETKSIETTPTTANRTPEPSFAKRKFSRNTTPTKTVPSPQKQVSHTSKSMFSTASDLRRAWIAKEILDKPLALRLKSR